MAFLDFIKNRGGQQPAESQPRPETAKQMYTREATQDKTTAKSMAEMPPEQKAKVAEVKDALGKAIGQAQEPTSTQPATPADSTASPQPMAQMSMNQDKAAPALSPTSAQTGAREHEQESPKPARTPEREKQTIARHPPSWER